MRSKEAFTVSTLKTLVADLLLVVFESSAMKEPDGKAVLPCISKFDNKAKGYWHISFTQIMSLIGAWAFGTECKIQFRFSARQ